MKSKSAVLLFIITVSVTVSLLLLPALAQNGHAQESVNQSEGQVLREILDEVRQLRAAVQRANLGAYRSQVLIERLRMQQEHVARLNKQLEETRTEAASFKAYLPKMEEQLRDLEMEVGNQQNPAQRNQLEAQAKAVKQMLEAQAIQQQQLQERESQLAAQLQAEQATLATLNDQLQTIERELEHSINDGRPGPGK